MACDARGERDAGDLPRGLDVREAPRFAWKRELGSTGELLARNWLTSLNWRISHTNWRSGRFGEIDIVAHDETGMLVFCEVKTRIVRSHEEAFRNDGFEAVDWRKRRKIISCAMSYIYRNCRQAVGCRFDVIVIEYDLQKINVRPSDYFPLNEKSFALLSNLTPTIRHVTMAFF